MDSKNRTLTPKQSLIILFGFFVIGIVVMFSQWTILDFNLELLIIYIWENLAIVIFGLVFAIIGLLGFISNLTEVVMKPKKEVLYLKEIIKMTNVTLVFKDKKGKELTYTFKVYPNIYEIGQYYEVMRKNYTINEIIGLSQEEFIPDSPKESYWLNCYLPFGTYKNVAMLPVVYFIGLISFLFFVETKNIETLIMAIASLYLIIYDYKIKKNKY